ncbi:MAG: GNAT family N-acetyltransferase [Bacillus sp. (in: firmicutes)]
MNIHITKGHIKEDKQIINKALMEFNRRHLPQDLQDTYEEVNLFLKDEEGRVRGGLLAEICWNWLQIDILIIDEELRGKGYGEQLLMEAEQIALKKDCHFIKLDTLSFQARSFYEKHGYQIYGTLDGVGREFEHYYMKKDL